MTDATRAPIVVSELDGGAVWRVALAVPKANILDAAMTRALIGVFERACQAPRLCAVLLCAEGPHFSFGASVQEHLPDAVEGMLTTFHALFRRIAESRVPLIGAVRGQCLGGGLELAAFAHRLFASPDAKLGQPEIKLGVIAPVASALLPERIGIAAATDLCLSGRTVNAEQALALGLVDALADDPETAALQWIRDNLLAHSASSVRFATQAVRDGLHLRFFAKLDRLERLYLDHLMATADAPEGIHAFLDKRNPVWRHA
ncbi:MAG: cyclohexa-1,5-dienecarbonyl-CoA hydratase [Planctomycetota bacterium]